MYVYLKIKSKSKSSPVVFIYLSFMGHHLNFCVFCMCELSSKWRRTLYPPKQTSCLWRVTAASHPKPRLLSHCCYFHPRFLYFCLRLKRTAVIYFLSEIHYLVVAGVRWMVGVGLINSGSLLPPTPHSSPTQLVNKDCVCLWFCVCVWLCGRGGSGL